MKVKDFTQNIALTKTHMRAVEEMIGFYVMERKKKSFIKKNNSHSLKETSPCSRFVVYFNLFHICTQC